MVSLPFVVSIFHLVSANHPEQGVKCFKGDLMVQKFGVVFFVFCYNPSQDIQIRVLAFQCSLSPLEFEAN